MKQKLKKRGTTHLKKQFKDVVKEITEQGEKASKKKN
jgi:hypothetical protein